MTYSLLKTQRQGGILTLTLHSPPLNLLGHALRGQLRAALAESGSDATLRCIVLAGGPRAWSAGADLTEEQQLQTAADVSAFLQDFSATTQAVDDCPVPVIGAIAGACMGGGLELALHCDFRYAADTARFAAPGVKVGLIASSYLLPRLIGEGRARELLYTARTLDSAEAARIGLVNQVVPDSELLSTVAAVAAEIAARAPRAVRANKAVVSAGLDHGYAAWLQAHQHAFLQLAASADHKEAVQAFLEKRPPVFTGQ